VDGMVLQDVVVRERERDFGHRNGLDDHIIQPCNEVDSAVYMQMIDQGEESLLGATRSSARFVAMMLLSLAGR
jgi:hypothetical protein